MKNPLDDMALLLKAGFSNEDAFERAFAESAYKHRSILFKLKKGSCLSEAFFAAGFISSAERIMLAAAEQGGFVPRALQLLAKQRDQVFEKKRYLKSRLIAVLAVFFIAFITSLLLTVFKTDVPFTDILFSHLMKLAVVILLLKTLYRLLEKDQWFWCALGWRFHLMREPIFQLCWQVSWIRLLHWQLSAGLDALTALKSLQGLIKTQSYNSAMFACLRDIENGCALMKTLKDSGLVFGAELSMSLFIAEKSGAITEGLGHQIILAEQRFNDHINTLIRWLPRVMYIFILMISLSMFP